jgi:hypothetical protein
MAKKAAVAANTIEIQTIELAQATYQLYGITPLIMHRFDWKAWQELLMPSRKKNQAEKEASLKHDPVNEFRNCIYLNRDRTRKALIHLPEGAIHQCVAAAAIDMPGAKRTQMERLTGVVDTQIDLFGVPQMFMRMVRNSDMNRTPDVRTRPIFPQWACSVTIRWVKNRLTEKTIGNLIGAAGQIVGIGDWRPERGGSYGRFNLVAHDDRRFLDIVNKQGRVAQDSALKEPIYFDDDTREIMTWFESEVSTREVEHLIGVNSRKPNGKRKVVTVKTVGGKEHVARH